MRITGTLAAGAAAALLSATLTARPAAAQAVTFVGMGDSIGEGVQSADASQVTQRASFVNLIAWRMGAALPLPLIRTNVLGTVGDTTGRARVDPSVRTSNLAVSGASVHSILHNRATAATPAQIDNETELVLFPHVGSQIEVAEQLRPQYAVVSIGNNDALRAALAFDRLDATQLTPVADFTMKFTELVQRLHAVGTKAAFSTIPDITGIGFLATRQDMIRLLGSDHGVPQGSLVGLPTVLLVRLGLTNGAIFNDPDYVLDPAEQQTISVHVDALNEVIRTTVAAHGMALADTHAVFDDISANGMPLFGVTLTTRFLGGILSLDGVHPSNIGHAIIASHFIEALNRRYGAGIPPLTDSTLYWLTATDPFVDKDGDGRVPGRFGAGLLETVFAILGFSGDITDGWLPSATISGASAARATSGDARIRARALDAIQRATGRDLRKASRTEQVEAMKALFDTSREDRR